MAMTLITTNTSSNAATSDFTSSIDSTYKLYIFKFYDVNPATDGGVFEFQANAAGASGYNETMTTTFWNATHYEDDGAAAMGYGAGSDQAQGTAFQDLSYGIGNGGDESLAGELHLFNPSNTTYVKNFYSTWNHWDDINRSINSYVAGYFNTTSAINAISFNFSSSYTTTGTIAMYGTG